MNPGTPVSRRFSWALRPFAPKLSGEFFPAGAPISSSADSSLSARCLEAEEWLRQVYHGGCPCASSLYARAVCMCVRACVRVYLCACACTPRYDRCNWRFSAPSLIGLRIGLRRDCRHWWGRYATTCACPCGGAGTCVQWNSSVVLSCVLSSVLRPRHAVAPRASRHFKAPASARPLLAPQTSLQGAAGEPRKNPRYCAR